MIVLCHKTEQICRAKSKKVVTEEEAREAEVVGAVLAGGVHLLRVVHLPRDNSKVRDCNN